MANRIQQVLRRVAPVLSAGVLLQTTGCQVNTNELFAGLASTIITNAITTWVFGIFSVGTGF